MKDLLGDLKYAVRTLVKSPAFCTVALVSPTLGIGANTAIFTLVDPLLLRLLPVRDPQQLVLLSPRGANYSFSYLMYTDDGIDPSHSPAGPRSHDDETTDDAGSWYRLSDRSSPFTQIFGRLKPGVTVMEALRWE